jgi:hypothetical protein
MKRIHRTLLLAAFLFSLILSVNYVVAQDDSYFDVKAPSTFLYADKTVYQAGESLILKMRQDGSNNPFPFDHRYTSYFLYLENLQTGEKVYHPSNEAHPDVSDMFGTAADAAGGRYQLYRVPTIEFGADRDSDFVLFGTGGYMGGARSVPTEPGTYRWVMELRDASGTYVESLGYAPFTVVEEIETLSGDISEDRTLSNRKAYILDGMVFVRPPATLTIEAGTIIFGDTGSQGGLCITQGAKIHAVGTAGRPIVFTSSAAIGERTAGDWFGVAIAGYAPINIGGIGSIEGIETESYGGEDPDDDSGIMRYVRIEFAGLKFTPTREANGLYLNGVGRGTVLEYLHFNQNQDDNIEFFGGTAQIKYVYCSGGGDDQLDWTEGWQGKGQFIITHVFQNSAGNRGIEADNWSDGHDATPRSSPMIYNMTIVGPQQNYAEGEGVADHGLMLRRGTAGKFYNFIVIGYGRDAINIKDDATIAQANAGNLVFDHAILYNNGIFGADGVGTFGNTDTENWITARSNKVLTEMDPRLVDPYNELTPDYSPGYMSPALRIDVVKAPPDDGFFSPVTFIGGMSPYHNWLAGGWVYVTPW